MDEKTLIAKRVALELKDGDLVNLGIGLPTFVAAFVPKDADIFFQSENGIIGMLALPEEGLEGEDLTDAGGGPIGALPGAATFDSAMSFGLALIGFRGDGERVQATSASIKEPSKAFPRLRAL